MTKLWSSTTSDLTKTKREASKEQRRAGRNIEEEMMDCYQYGNVCIHGRSSGETCNECEAAYGERVYRDNE